MAVLFMAFENNYMVREYVASEPGSMGQALEKGYRNEWSSEEIVQMLAGLLANDAAWGLYFQSGTQQRATLITCYKYRAISVDDAFANLAGY